MILCEELPGALVRYELLCETLADGRQAYGIRITSRLPYDMGSIFVSDITESAALAAELLRRAVAYVVTPCELVYVIEDFICEKYSV